MKYYCINYFINTKNITFFNSILVNYDYEIISTFENNSSDPLMLFEIYNNWLIDIQQSTNQKFNLTNFAFVNYDKISTAILKEILYNYFRNSCPIIYNYTYYISDLLSKTYGFESVVPIRNIIKFLKIKIDKDIIKNLECNYLLQIFIICKKDYGDRFNYYKQMQI
uniref:Uncharacterized protein n=1 Tax=viral metagenome TaxID=1070528 RepID=A0A6C0DCC6_9ZZZZ